MHAQNVSSRPVSSVPASAVSFGAVVVLLVLASCTKDPAKTPPDAPDGSAAVVATAPATTTVARPGAKNDHAPLAFIHDDFATAMAEAKAKKRPVVVDLWAPWCHTCVSMQKTVLKDARVVDKKDTFVWLALDTDRPENSASLAPYPISVWPTFLVLDENGAVLARHQGGASVDEFVRFLDAATGDGGTDDVKRLVRTAKQRAVAGDVDAAIAAHRQALAKGGAAWPGRFSTRIDLIAALEKSGQAAACLSVVEESLDDMALARSAITADFVAVGFWCAKAVGGAREKAFLDAVTKDKNVVLTVVDDATSDLSADDRSDALRILREIHIAHGDDDTARKLATRQLKILDDAMRSTTDPEFLAGLLWPWEEVAVYLGEGARLVDDMGRIVDAMPGAYDPPYRLAWLLLQLGRHDDAKVYAEKALAAVYGPRKVRAFVLLGDIETKRGDKEGQRRAWQGIKDTVDGLSDKTRHVDAVRIATEKLDALD